MGFRQVANGIAVDFRAHDRAEHELTIEGESASSMLTPVAYGSQVFVGFASGRIYRIAGGQVNRISAGDRTDQLLHVSCDAQRIIATVVEEKRVAIRVTTHEGSNVGKIVLNYAGVSANPVVLDDRAYVFGDADGSLSICDLKGLTVNGEAGGPAAVKRIRAAVGLSHLSKHYLLVASFDEPGNPARVVAYDPETGASVKLCALQDQVNIDIIVANGRPVVGTSASFVSQVRIYDLSTAS